MSNSIIKQIIDGRTDLVFDYLAEGHAATSTDKDGVSFINCCAYFGDVSGIKFLLANGESIQSLGDNLDLNGAAIHGHWRLCQFNSKWGTLRGTNGTGKLENTPNRHSTGAAERLFS